MSQCQTTVDWINRARLIHGDKYDYSKSTYINRNSKVIIICCSCKQEFVQSAYHHLRGSGCPRCAKLIVSNKLKSPLDRFMDLVNSVHGDKYNYSLVTNWSRRSKQRIICKIHGEFAIKIGNLLSGSGCPTCARCLTALKRTKTLAQFINSANLIHKNRYEYLSYSGALNDVEIRCCKHGVFKQKAYYHLRGGGCPLCVVEARRHNIEAFVDKSRLTHGSRYDYSMSDYKSNKEKVEIICHKHGKFVQEPHCHWSGQGCPQCAIDNSKNTIDHFICLSNIKHSNKYDYSKVKYNRAHDKVTIVCPNHGEFDQKANNHLNGQGCPRCVSTVSSQQIEIAEFVKVIAPDQEILFNNRVILPPYEVDLYIPNMKIGIEYHGIYWHSYDRCETLDEKMYHCSKATAAASNGIRLYQIFEHFWLNKTDIVKSIISHAFNKSRVVYARQTKLVDLSNVQYNEFMDNNHLYGHRTASVKIGLVYDGELIACMSFHRSSEGWEITRYACKLFHTVVGGPSKLLHNFISNHDGNIITYADRCYSLGNMYKQMGFSMVGITKPNYFYYKGNTVYSRQQFQKHKLQTKLAVYDSNLTESENMFNNGYRRFWDAGHFKLIRVGA